MGPPSEDDGKEDPGEVRIERAFLCRFNGAAVRGQQESLQDRQV